MSSRCDESPLEKLCPAPILTDVLCPQCLEFVHRAWPSSSFTESRLELDAGALVCPRCDARYDGAQGVLQDYTDHLKDVLDDLNWTQSALNDLEHGTARTAA